MTRLRVKAIFDAMRKSHPLKLLLQALSLAVVGLAMSVGSAFAHGGHGQPQVHATATHAEHQAGHASDGVASLEFAQTDDEELSTAPCRGESSGHAAGEGCCTIACHAALAAPTADAVGTVDLPGTRIVGLADMLEGRSSDRTERPPKLG